VNYYKNHIIYNTKYNNILEINTINYTKKTIIFFILRKKYNNSFNINYTKKINKTNNNIFTINTLKISYTKKNNKKTKNNIFNTNTCNYTKSIGNPSTTWHFGCTQKETDQAPGGAGLRAWVGAVQAPRGAWSARDQDPILFLVLPYQAQG
jgi:hypothetical protein